MTPYMRSGLDLGVLLGLRDFRTNPPHNNRRSDISINKITLRNPTAGKYPEKHGIASHDNYNLIYVDTYSFFASSFLVTCAHVLPGVCFFNMTRTMSVFT